MANAMLDARQEGGSYRRIEVITGQRRRSLLIFHFRQNYRTLKRGQADLS